MAISGANEYGDELRKTPNDHELRSLHGTMIINVWSRVGGFFCNVDFGVTEPGLAALDYDVVMALKGIRQALAFSNASKLNTSRARTAYLSS